MVSPFDPKAAKRISKLYVLNSLEVKDEFEDKWENSFNNLQSKLKDLSEKETHETLVAAANQNYEEVACGFLFGILTDPREASKYYRDLSFVTRDGMMTFATKLNYILVERYSKLLEIPRQQILWTVRESIKNNMQYMDHVCSNVLRDVVGTLANVCNFFVLRKLQPFLAGDASAKNVWLADTLLSIFVDFKPWLEKYPGLMANVVYCYLRLISDHVSPGLESLRSKEIKFCVTLLKEKMVEIINFGGREIGRALSAVSRIPECEKLLQEISLTPSLISAQFNGIWHLFSARCQKRVTLFRLTVEMERKIYFLLTNVRLAAQSKYLEWLQRQFLSAPESATMRSDIIRYVCCMVHPSNEILASDIVPRWQFILWLMSTCPTPAETQLCRMALFYDYLFYDPEKDSIMNIEPAVLLLYNCSKTQPSLFLSLMDFITRITVTFCPPVCDQIKSCIVTSFKTLQDKKVVPSLAPIFDSSKIDAELKLIIREVFDEFCTKEKEEELPAPPQSSSPKLELSDIPLSMEDDNDVEDINETNSLAQNADDNDDSSLVIDNGNEEEPAAEIPIKRERRTSQLAMWESEGSLINPFDDPAPADISKFLEQLDPNLRSAVEDMQNLSESEFVRGERLYKVVTQVFNLQDDFDEDQATYLAECLCGFFRPFFARKVFPEKVDSENDLEDSLQAPIFVIFRNLSLTPDEDSASQQPLLMLVSEMYLKQSRIGYLLLFFMKVASRSNEKWSVYKDLCKMLDEDLDNMLLKDMQLCQEDDYRLFIYLVPEVYRKFSTFAQQSAELMHLVVSTIDAVQLQELICEIFQGNLTMFRREGFLNLLSTSLKWETIEQYFLWQFINAQEISLDWMLPIIQKLSFPLHAEAMANVLLILKRMDREPTKPLVRQIFSREVHQKNDLFAVSALKILIDDFEDKMADLITSLLQNASTTPEPAGHLKGKKQPAKILTLDPILGHLDMFRRHNKQLHNFFSKDSVQQIMQDVKKSASDSLKTKYSELFAMMEILDSVRDGRNLRRGRKVMPTSSGSRHSGQGDSSEDEHSTKSSPVKQQVKKKRKIVESESD